MTLIAGLPVLENVVIRGVEITARQATSGSFNVRVLSQDAKGNPQEPAAIVIMFDPEHPDQKVEAIEGAKIPCTREGKKLIVKRILVWLYGYGIKEVKFSGATVRGKNFFAEIFQDWRKLGVQVGKYAHWLPRQTKPRWRLQVELAGLSRELARRIPDPEFQRMKKGRSRRRRQGVGCQ